MILTHESGAQEDQFDGKEEGQKSRGTIPLRIVLSITIASSRTVVHVVCRLCSLLVIQTIGQYSSASSPRGGAASLLLCEKDGLYCTRQ